MTGHRMATEHDCSFSKAHYYDFESHQEKNERKRKERREDKLTSSVIEVGITGQQRNPFRDTTSHAEKITI